MEPLSGQVQAQYAELVERLTARDAARTIGDLPGTFVRKRVKGQTYVYFQHVAPGGALRQLYLGRRTPALDAVARRFEVERRARSEDRTDIDRLCAQLRAGGAAVTDAASARVVSALAAAAVFRLGGVLVGTHAFIVLGNLLGVRWVHGATRTEDVDVAGERSLAVAIPELAADIPRVLASLEMGFLPVPGLAPDEPSTSFKVRGRALRVDVLTPAVGKARGPVRIQRFGTAAEPVRFLEYLLEEFQPAAMIDGGGVLVNVPHPARFALHKLMVARLRPVAMQTKSAKDIDQAAQLIRVLARDRPGDLEVAWEACARRGPGWMHAVDQGVATLRRRAADAASMVERARP